MTLAAFLYLLAVVLAGVGAFANPPRVSLLALAVACLAAGLFCAQLGVGS